MRIKTEADRLLAMIREGRTMSAGQKVRLAVMLSVPAVVAQLSSIVAYGVYVGAADTLKPCLMNFLSIWAVRLTMAAWLAPTMGLRGVWIAMCVELTFRGAIFLVHLWRRRWMKAV